MLDQEPHDEAFFWATHQGAEVDLILRLGSELRGIEIKRRDAPKLTPSIRNGLHDLGLQQVVVIYPGDKAYPLSDQVRVIPLSQLATGDSLFDG